MNFGAADGWAGSALKLFCWKLFTETSCGCGITGKFGTGGSWCSGRTSSCCCCVSFSISSTKESNCLSSNSLLLSAVRKSTPVCSRSCVLIVSRTGASWGGGGGWFDHYLVVCSWSKVQFHPFQCWIDDNVWISSCWCCASELWFLFFQWRVLDVQHWLFIIIVVLCLLRDVAGESVKHCLPFCFWAFWSIMLQAVFTLVAGDVHDVPAFKARLMLLCSGWCKCMTNWPCDWGSSSDYSMDLIPQLGFGTKQDHCVEIFQWHPLVFATGLHIEGWAWKCIAHTFWLDKSWSQALLTLDSLSIKCKLQHKLNVTQISQPMTDGGVASSALLIGFHN